MTRPCGQCGSPLPSAGWEGLCPKCLVRVSLEPEVERGCPQPLHSQSALTGHAEVATSASGGVAGEATRAPFMRAFGDYELLEELARGGMGVVFRARQVSLNRVVAVKMILAGHLARDADVQRFRAEAAAAAQLQHPNIVAIHEVGVQDGQHFFSMDLVEGQNLTEFVRHRPLPAKQAARYLKAIAEAIHYAHQRGILHRDLKPSNILIDRADQPRVTDFGLAKQMKGDSDLTLSGQVLGSPNFMPPEQAAGKRDQIGPPSDVYGLGAILYFLLTARAPFAAETMTETLQQVMNTDPPAPRLLNPGLSRDLETICLKCLEKEPGKRYASAQELAEELGRFLDDEPIRARPVSQLEKRLRWCRRNPVLAGSLAAAAALLLVVALGSPIAAFRINRERQKAERNAAESRSRLVRQYVANGNRLVQEHDYLGALPWFAHALKEDRDNLERASIHRLRLALTMQQCPKLAQLYSHDGAVNHAEFSPDGKSVLSSSDDHTARIWDTMSGELSAPPLQHESAVNHAAFNADGRWVVTASADGTARVWDAATGKPRTPSLRHAGSVSYASFSPDSTLVLTVSDDHTARIWNAATGEAVIPPLQHDSRVNHGSFSPDGRLVATACEDAMPIIWDVKTGKPRASVLHGSKGRGSRLFLAQFSPDGTRLLTAGLDADLWDVATGQRLSTFSHYPDPLQCVCFSPDGRRVATGSYDRTARIWDAATGNPLTPPLRHDREVWSVCFSRNGATLLTASLGCNVRLWSTEKGEILTGIIRQSSPARTVSFSPDGRQILVASQSQNVSLWDLAGAEPMVSHLPTTSVVYDAAFSPDGHIAILLALAGEASAWDLVAAKPLDRFGTNLNVARCAHFSTDGRRLALGRSDGWACVWDFASAKQTSPPLQHIGSVNHVEFSPDAGRLVTAGGDTWARVWDVSSGRCLAQMPHHGPVAYAAFTPDGEQVVTATVNRPQVVVTDPNIGIHELFDDPRTGLYAVSNVVQLWDAHTGKATAPPLHIPPAASLLTFSPDHRRVVNSCSSLGYSGEDAAYLRRGRAEVCIWDVKSGLKLSPDLFIGTADCLYAGFSPDGTKLVTTSIEQMARVWNGFTGKSIGPVLPHGREVYHASFSPDSRLVATASRDGTVRLWEADTSEPVGPPLDHRFWHTENPLASVPVRVFFSPDGQRLVSCNRTRQTHVWELPRESRPVEDDWLVAELLANATIDETGTLASLDMNRAGLKSDWRSLLGKYPTTLGVAPQQVSFWKQRQADEYYQLGCARFSAHQCDEALAGFNQAIALDPHFDQAYKQRGDVFRYLEESEKAAANFQTEIEMCPESADGYNGLASLYVNGPAALRNPEKALPLALKAVELSQHHVDEVRTLGMIYYRLGQWDKAVETLEKCARASGIGATAYDFFFLVMAHARLGQLPLAEEYYAKGMESWKNHPVWFGPRYEKSMQRYSAEARAEIQKLKESQTAK